MHRDHSPWTKDELQDVIDCIALGMTAHEIAGNLNRTVSAVRDKGYYFGMKFARKPRALRDHETTKEQVSEIKARYGSGQSITEIWQAVAPEKSRITVYKICRGERRLSE